LKEGSADGGDGNKECNERQPIGMAFFVLFFFIDYFFVL
jgi:hypothetical protein